MNKRLQRHRLTIGAKVLCRFYNAQDHKFYGKAFTAIVTDIYWQDWNNKQYEVEIGSEEVQAGAWATMFTRVLHRNEIKRVLESGILGLHGEYRKIERSQEND